MMVTTESMGDRRIAGASYLPPVASSRFSEKLCLAQPANVPSKSFGGVIEAVVLAAIGVSTSLLYPPLVLQASCY